MFIRHLSLMYQHSSSQITTYCAVRYSSTCLEAYFNINDYLSQPLPTYETYVGQAISRIAVPLLFHWLNTWKDWYFEDLVFVRVIFGILWLRKSWNCSGRLKMTSRESNKTIIASCKQKLMLKVMLWRMPPLWLDVSKYLTNLIIGRLELVVVQCLP